MSEIENLHTITAEFMDDDKQSSAEILDGLFRELEEKSAKGELSVQSDFSTVLGATLTSDELPLKHAHRKRKSSRHKHSHSHKHKKHKKHKSSHSSDSHSADEWVPSDLKSDTVIKANIDQSESVERLDNKKAEEVPNACVTTENNLVIENADNKNGDNCEEKMSDGIESVANNEPPHLKPQKINEEPMLFIPRVTRLDRKAFKRQPVVPVNTDPVKDVENAEKMAVDDEKSATSETLPAILPFNVEKSVKDGLSLSKDSVEETSAAGNDDGVNEEINERIPVVHISAHDLKEKYTTKLRSKITRFHSKKSSKSHGTTTNVKRKKKAHTEKEDVSTGKEPGERKHKPKKLSKSKKTSHGSKSRSKSPSISRRSHHRSRSTSRSRQSTSRSRIVKSKFRRRSRSTSRESGKRHSASSSPSRRLARKEDRLKSHVSILGEKIDKAKLLEIARKNAMAMMAEGKLPLPVSLGLEKPQQEKRAPAPFKVGGKSVEELTDFCKQLAEKEKEEGELSADDSNGRPHHSSDEEDKGTPFVHHHPFKLREQPNIIMNIRNAVQIPIKTPAEKVVEGSKLRIQFPVSSGTQHRKKEWVPVSPKKETEVVKEKEKIVAKVEEVTVFQPPTDEISVDIGAIVSQRLKAVRKLMDNPHDVEALNQMYKSQQEMQNWAQSKQLPGQFTGTTDVQLLTPQQLAGPAHLQAWVKKDQFNRAAPVQGGFGMYMLQKMGWKPGEGLGKNKEGTAEPIVVDIKMDKKGLVSQGEITRKTIPAAKDLSGKHPVSALVELCNKRRWLPPEFILVHDSGPDHKKNFLFKVRINGQDYQPTVASLNKKQGKVQAATVCLQALGLVPRDLNNPL